MAITASIVASRSSGIAPLGVHFDATGTLSDATALTNNYGVQFTGASASEVVGIVARNNLVYCPSGTNRNFASSTPAELTLSNNSASEPGANGMGDSPTFAGSNGDGTGTFTVPNDFKILSGSYANGAGTSVPVFDDYFGRSRLNVTKDMGFYQLNEGDPLSEGGGGEPSAILMPQIAL